MRNSLNETDDFIKIIHLLNRTDEFLKNDTFI